MFTKLVLTLAILTACSVTATEVKMRAIRQSTYKIDTGNGMVHLYCLRHDNKWPWQTCAVAEKSLAVAYDLGRNARKIDRVAVGKLQENMILYSNHQAYPSDRVVYFMWYKIGFWDYKDWSLVIKIDDGVCNMRQHPNCELTISMIDRRDNKPACLERWVSTARRIP